MATIGTYSDVTFSAKIGLFSPKIRKVTMRVKNIDSM